MKNTAFKPALLRLKIDLALYPTRDETFRKYLKLVWIFVILERFPYWGWMAQSTWLFTQSLLKRIKIYISI